MPTQTATPSVLFATAYRAHQAGHLKEAERLYRQVLTLDAHHGDTLHALGLLAHQVGQYAHALVYFRQAIAVQPTNGILWQNTGEAYRRLGQVNEAMASYRHAIRLQPGLAVAHANLGHALQSQGQLDEAAASYQRALQIEPHNVEVCTHLGALQWQQGKLAEAVTSYQQALRLQPESANLRTNLGDLLQLQGQFAAAIAYYRQALQLDPHRDQTHTNLGVALQTQGELEAAETHLRQAVHLCPDSVEALSNLGNVLHARGQYSVAQQYLTHAVQLQPQFVVAHNNLGLVLQAQGQHTAAEEHLRQALHYAPTYAKAHNNLGTVLQSQGRLDEAVCCFTQALCLQPDFLEALNNLGLARQAQGQVEEAIACFSRLLDRQPDFVRTRWNRAIAWLLVGNFAQGWDEYAWRWQRPETPLRTLTQPLWSGEPLSGQTILVYAEQGLGDTLQFMRYLPLVQAQGGRVLFECQPELLHLLQGSTGYDALYAYGQPATPPEPYDRQVPLLDLPRLFRTTLDTIPAAIPYVSADVALVEKWRTRLAQHEGIRVGLVWAGNPSHHNDRNRSCPLAACAPLGRVAGMTFFSLQKGAAAAQVACPPAGLQLVDVGAELDDFADTAAVIAQLDVVICVDTAVAHLAGAMGRPVWLTLPFAPDWRWLLQRQDSPWYPTMRLFRQPRPGDWTTVFQHMADNLGALQQTT